MPRRQRPVISTRAQDAGPWWAGLLVLALGSALPLAHVALAALGQ